MDLLYIYFHFYDLKFLSFFVITSRRSRKLTIMMNSLWPQVDFGSVLFPADLDPPKPRVLSEFKRLAHGLRSGSVTILDAKTFYIPNLHYDGAAPDAFFWVGSGTEPTHQGIKVPNELGE